MGYISIANPRGQMFPESFATVGQFRGKRVEHVYYSLLSGCKTGLFNSSEEGLFDCGIGFEQVGDETGSKVEVFCGLFEKFLIRLHVIM